MFNDLLNSLLSAGQDMVQQGKDVAEDKLNIPEDADQRQAMMGGMGKGALAAGALALLLGTKTGRSIGGGALKVGSVAALGGLAYKAYQNWQDEKGGQVAANTPPPPPPPQALENLSASDTDIRSQKLLQAIIAAAKADGHIDDNERAIINEFVGKMGESAEASAFIQTELNKPLNPAEVASGTDAPGLAAEVYLMSRMIIDDSNFMEKAYLGELAKALNLADDLVAKLDAQVAQATA